MARRTSPTGNSRHSLVVPRDKAGLAHLVAHLGVQERRRGRTLREFTEVWIGKFLSHEHRVSLRAKADAIRYAAAFALNGTRGPRTSRKQGPIRFSVLMPVFRVRRRYLRRAIDSVRR